jgi:hypothetical protein
MDLNAHAEFDGHFDIYPNQCANRNIHMDTKCYAVFYVYFL